MKGKYFLAVTLVGTVITIGMLATLEAAEKYTVSGTNYKSRPTDPKITELPDGRQIVRVASDGFVVTERPANFPVPVYKHHCVGTLVRSADGRTTTGWGYCDSFDADGDVHWHYWSGSGEPGSMHGTYSIIGGTGKFKGAKGSGTWKNTGKGWADGSWTDTFEGTIELQ
jgi:hypothetical protein